MAMNPRLLRPLATGFDPRSIGNLAVWFDASRFDSFTWNGSPGTGTVLSWADQSGNGRDGSQADANRQFAYSATAANGRPAVTIPSGSRNVATAGFADTATATVFAVADITNTSFAGLFQRGGVNERHSGFRGTTVNPDTLFARRGSSAEGSVAYSGGYAIMQCSFSSTLSRVSVNGTAGSDNTATVSATFTNPILRVGSLGDGILGMAGGIGEFLYYDALLSDAAATAVRRYLAAKFGLTTT